MVQISPYRTNAAAVSPSATLSCGSQPRTRGLILASAPSNRRWLALKLYARSSLPVGIYALGILRSKQFSTGMPRACSRCIDRAIADCRIMHKDLQFRAVLRLFALLATA